MKKDKTGKERYASPAPAVEQAAEIIMYLASGPQITASVTDIGRAIGIAKSKTYSLLTALQSAGFVTKNSESKLYSLGWGLIPVGQQALQNINSGDAARPFLEVLAQKTQCTALFGLVQDEHCVITAVAQSDQPVESRLKLGRVLSLYEGALGKVVAACLPEEEQKALLASERFQSHWNPSKFDYRQIKAELDIVRNRSYVSHVVGDQVKSIIKLIASAVHGPGSSPVGILFVVGIIANSDIPRYGAILAQTARELSTRWGYTEKVPGAVRGK